MAAVSSKVRALFDRAAEIATDAEREAYLAGACADDADARRQVEALLQAYRDAGSFLDQPAVAGDAAVQVVATDGSGSTEAFGGPGGDHAAGMARESGFADAGDNGLPFLTSSTRPDSLGKLGHYEVLQVIGRGGFGIVLRAIDERLHRVVAIKVLTPAYAVSGGARKRFIREARAAAAVKNEHLVSIHDVQEDADPPYFVMECIDGIALQDKLDKHGPLGIKEILRIGMQIAEGLAAAHKLGLVHRDIKPANILLENGVERVKITDFGLARAVDDASLTQSGTVAGTPMYMSPEQAEGAHVDHRSDLFSLGTVLYAMCTGHAPFRASSTHAVLKRVIDAAPRAIREINNEVPEWLCNIVVKLHAKKPEDRFQTAKEVAELLGQHLAHEQQPNQTPMPARAALAAIMPVAPLGRLRIPANGLIASGILYWITIPVFVVMSFVGPLDTSFAKMPPMDDRLFGFLWARLGLLPAVAGFVLIFAGWKMRHRELYWLCLFGACLPFALLLEKLITFQEHRITVALGDWTALPFGMWALIVLTRRDVRESFSRANAGEPSRVSDRVEAPAPGS